MGSVGARNGAVAPTPIPMPAPTPEPPAVSGQPIDDNSIVTLRQQMGQTGYEAGDPNAPSQRKLYVKTSKAFNINTYLATDGATMHTSQSQWDSLGYTERMVKNDIARIDSGMKPLPYNIQTYRFIDGNALGRIMGQSWMNNRTVRYLVQDLDSGAKSLSDMSTALKNTSYTQKAYTSTTYDTSHPAFDTYPVRLNVVAMKGTPAIATINTVEHEILVGRGRKYNFTGGCRIRHDRYGNPQLEIDVQI